MKKQITLGEAIGFAVIIITTVIGAWVTISKDVARHDERIKNLENSGAKIEMMLQKIIDGQQELSIKIENKQDRPR